MSLNIGWVGTAHIHTPGFINTFKERGYKCAGVYDHDEARAHKNAEALGSEASSLQNLTQNASVDGWIICSETIYHLDIVKAIAPLGKPIFVEKPMGASGEQSSEIAKLFEMHNIPFQTGYFSRGRSGFRTIKKLYDNGHFGQVTRVRASNCHSGALGGWFDGEWRWMADKKLSGVGAFGDLGTHLLDILMWIVGDVEKVTGILKNGTARYADCEEFGEALLVFKNGVVGVLAAGWDDVSDPIRLQIAGTKGHATLGSELLVAGADGKLAPYLDPEPDVPAGLNSFFDFLEGKPAELVKAKEAAARDRVMSAIYQSNRDHTWVSI